MNIKTVYIEITNQCNFNCLTCYNASGLNNISQELSIEQIDSIVSLFSSYGADRFLFAGGEPTLHSNFDHLLSWIKTRPDLSFGFVTNGSSNSESFIGLLNQAPNITLQISLDGSCEEQNAKTRGIGNFDKAINFVKKIHNPHQKPLLKMVISQNNVCDVEDFYKLALSLDCIPEFAFIYKSGNGKNHWEDKIVSAQDKIKTLKLIEALNHKYQINAYIPRCDSICPLVKETNQMSICVKVNGSIQPCQSLYDANYTLGNALNFDFMETQKNITRICSLAQRRIKTDYGCSKCIIKHICGRGCIAEAVHLTNDPLSNDENCNYRKLQYLKQYI